MKIKCEWNEQKRQENLLKHKVDFEDAREVLEDVHLIFEDKRRDYGESRYIAAGTLRGRIVIIVYTKRGDYYRIISARKANVREQKAYSDQLKLLR